MMTLQPETPRYNLFGAEFKANPHPTYAAMRAEHPVCRRTSNDGQSTIWFVTRYDDVAAMLRDHKRFVKNFRSTRTPAELAQLPPEPELLRLISNHMLNLDGADHARLRGLVNKAFTGAMVEQMASRVQAIADQLIRKVYAKGQMDLIDEYAFPLPIIVIAELLGIPPRDRNRFRNWSHAFVTSTANVQRSAKKLAKAGRIMQDFTRYLGRIFDERRQQPQPDLITSLLQAEEAGDRLSQDELFSMVILLIVAGHETAANLIGNGALALLQHPHQMARLRADPALIPRAVEEMLRFDPPVERATIRFAAEDVSIDGQTIRRGDVVSLVLAGANRDPAHFACPHAFDPSRTNNRHLGFGLGAHYCLGAPLARLEGRIAIETLLDRLPNLRLAAPMESLRWRTVPVIRGMLHMPVRWGEWRSGGVEE
ncbi:MAG: cytochrome P450 [Caldilineaceae bacterium]